MKDTDLMPFGKYKGTPMANVPDDYLLWIYDKLQIDQKKNIPNSERAQNQQIIDYIEDYGVENLKP